MPENLADWLGVLGFCLAVLLAGFEVWKYVQEKKERVRVDLRFQYNLNAASPLIATIVNVGTARVRLDKVELQLGPEHPEMGQSVCSIPLMLWGQGGGSPQRIPSVLEAGEKREYFVPAGHPVLPRFATADPSQLRLVVHSNRGPIARVSGEEVAHYLSASMIPDSACKPVVEPPRQEGHDDGE